MDSKEVLEAAATFFETMSVDTESDEELHRLMTIAGRRLAASYRDTLGELVAVKEELAGYRSREEEFLDSRRGT